MKLNDFFGRVCYINLDKRVDRLKRIEYVLDQNDICAMRVPGIDGNKWGWIADKYPHPMRAFNGVAGGTSVHIDIIRKALEDKRESVLLLEDDCEFTDNFQEKFNEWSRFVPDNWDLLYLGGVGGKGRYIKGQENPHVLIVTNMMATHAYAVSKRAYKKVIDFMMDDFPYLTDSIDGYLKQMQTILNAYTFNPPMVWQRADYSDVQCGYRDYTTLFKQLFK